MERKNNDSQYGTQHLFRIGTTSDAWVFLRLDQGEKIVCSGTQRTTTFSMGCVAEYPMKL